MNLFDLNSILMLVLLLAIIVLAMFVFNLYRRGVPREQLVEQTVLKGSDLLDTAIERAVSSAKQYVASLPEAKLKSAYFDSDDLLMDLGRLPPSYTQAVRLDGVIKRNGDAPGVDYYLHSNGNVNESPEK